MEECVTRYGQLVDQYLLNQSSKTYEAIKEQQKRYLRFKSELDDPANNPHVRRFKEYKSKLVKTNDQLLDATKDAHIVTIDKLKTGLQTVEETKQIATGIVQTLEENRITINNIDKGLTGVGGELQVSNKLVTRILKFISTNLLLLVVTLIIIALAIGIIVYKTR